MARKTPLVWSALEVNLSNIKYHGFCIALGVWSQALQFYINQKCERRNMPFRFIDGCSIESRSVAPTLKSRQRSLSCEVHGTGARFASSATRLLTQSASAEIDAPRSRAGGFSPGHSVLNSTKPKNSPHTRSKIGDWNTLLETTDAT